MSNDPFSNPQQTVNTIVGNMNLINSGQAVYNQQTGAVTRLPASGSSTAGPFADFPKFAAGFAVFALVSLGVSNTEYSEVATALVWLTAIGALTYWSTRDSSGGPFITNLKKLVS